MFGFMRSFRLRRGPLRAGAAFRILALAIMAAFTAATVATALAEESSDPITVEGVVESLDGSILVLTDGKVIVLDGTLPDGTEVTATVDVSEGELAVGALVSVEAVSGTGTAADPFLASSVEVLPAAEATPTPTGSPAPGATASPTASPGASPTPTPTSKPTATATATPTAKPTAGVTATPTGKPTAKPTASPTADADEESDEAESDTGDLTRIEGGHFELRGTLTAVQGNKYTINGLTVVVDPQAVPKLLLSGNLTVGARVRAKGLAKDAATGSPAGQTLFATEVRALEKAGEGVKAGKPVARTLFRRNSFEVRGTLTARAGDIFTINGVDIIADPSKVPHLQLEGNLVVGGSVVARGIVVRAGEAVEASPTPGSSATPSASPSPSPSAAPTASTSPTISPTTGITPAAQPAAGAAAYYATQISAVETGDAPKGAKEVVGFRKKSFDARGVLTAIKGNVYTIQGLAVVADPKAVKRLEIKGDPKVGDTVRAKGIISGGEGPASPLTYYATDIRAIKPGAEKSAEDDDSTPGKKATKFRLTGEVTALETGVLTIGDATIDITSAKVEGTLAVGVVVTVEGKTDPETGAKIASAVKVSDGKDKSKKDDDESGKKSGGKTDGKTDGKSGKKP